MKDLSEVNYPSPDWSSFSEDQLFEVMDALYVRNQLIDEQTRPIHFRIWRGELRQNFTKATDALQSVSHDMITAIHKEITRRGQHAEENTTEA